MSPPQAALDALRGELPLVGAAALLLLLTNLRLGRYALLPLQLLTVWAHECAHGVAALVVGGEVRKLEVFADGSGLAWTQVPDTRLRRAAVSSAGYVGAAALGAALLALRAVPGAGAAPLLGLGAAVLLSVLLWVRNLFGVLAMGGVGAALVAAGIWLPPAQARFVLVFVGAALSLNALSSLRALFGGQQRAGGKLMPSDAQQVAKLLWLPAWLWASLWLLTALALTALALGGPALTPR